MAALCGRRQPTVSSATGAGGESVAYHWQRTQTEPQLKRAHPKAQWSLVAVAAALAAGTLHEGHFVALELMPVIDFGISSANGGSAMFYGFEELLAALRAVYSIPSAIADGRGLPSHSGLAT